MKLQYDKRRKGFIVFVGDDEPESDTQDTTEDGERFLFLPAQMEVCGRCEGDGTHWHPAFDNGITQEDRDRDWDDESWEGLMSGAYDVRCTECNGEKVVPVPSERVPEDDRALVLYYEWIEDDRAYRAEVAAERRMGC